MARFKSNKNEPFPSSKPSKNIDNMEAKNENKLLPRKQKNPRPISKSKQKLIQKIKHELATGKLAAEDNEKRTQRDSRTLYIRFKDKENLPQSKEDVKLLHNGIKIVRLHRRAKKRLLYAFAEFESEKICQDAKVLLKKNESIYVDYVGPKSKSGGSIKDRSKRGKKDRPIHPTRLMVSGLIEGTDDEKLKQLFPKCVSAIIPKGSQRKGSEYGFVQFESPADAKAAFEAAKKLESQSRSIEGSQPISVFYARISKHKRKKPTEKDGKDLTNNESNKAKKSKTNDETEAENRNEMRNKEEDFDEKSSVDKENKEKEFKEDENTEDEDIEGEEESKNKENENVNRNKTYNATEIKEPAVRKENESTAEEKKEFDGKCGLSGENAESEDEETEDDEDYTNDEETDDEEIEDEIKSTKSINDLEKGAADGKEKAAIHKDKELDGKDSLEEKDNEIDNTEDELSSSSSSSSFVSTFLMKRNEKTGEEEEESDSE